MIDIIPVIPRGLIVHTDTLEDRNLAQKYPINATAAQFLSLVDGTRTLGMISSIIALQYQQRDEDVLKNITALTEQLYTHYLLNIRETWQSAIPRWLLCIRNGIIPTLWKQRYDPPHTLNYIVLLFWMCGIVSRKFLPLVLGFFGSVAILSQIESVISLLGIIPMLQFASLSLLIWACTVISIALHETSHLAAIKWKLGREIGFVACSGILIVVVRPSIKDLHNEMFVSLSGPLTPVLIAILAGIFYIFHPLWYDWIVIVIFGMHILQLVLPNKDIANITRMFRKR